MTTKDMLKLMKDKKRNIKELDSFKAIRSSIQRLVDRSDNKEVLVNFRFSHATKQRLELLSEIYNTNKSQLIRAVVDFLFEETLKMGEDMEKKKSEK